MIWLLALAIALFFEGSILLFFPQQWQEAMRQISALPPERLRKMGAVLSVTALLLVLWLKGTGSL